jgi:glutamine amidotransferase
VIAVGVVDLGTGNLFSVLRGLERAGAAPVLVRTAEEIGRSQKIILPGVGSFADASRRLREMNLPTLLQQAAADGKPILGICLGMQLLFEEGTEEGINPGLGLLKGRVVKLAGGPGLTVPHVGWQQLSLHAPNPLLPTSGRPWFWFSHSYRAEAQAGDVAAFAMHGEEIPAVVAHGRVFGIQPHPEKSEPAGLAFLKSFLALEARPS